MNKDLKFPPKFLWGASTSAYQVEGGNNNDWSKWLDAGRACDHYHLYEQDFDLIKELGQNAHRFSLEWSRIEPEEGKFNKKEINHYRDVLLALRKRNIKSVVTLWHFTNPLWFAQKGGWANKKAADYFKRYVKIVTENFGDLIDFWATLNEPTVFIGMGYLRGVWPPGKTNPFLAWKVLKNLIKAHKAAYEIIHQYYPYAQVTLNQLIGYVEPARRWCPVEVFIAKIIHYFSNSFLLNKVKNYLDFIGFDYYLHYRIVWYPPFVKDINKKRSDVGWEIYPKGIYFVLKYLARFKKPIYVLENGLADADDSRRAAFIVDHLKWIHRAISEGIDVRGYFHWSLMDNFEWAEGFAPRFGLVEINYKSLKRKIRPSAYLYAKICKANAIEGDILNSKKQ
ncbi:MAG: beta-glucosidase [Parcubacteria group bacterium Athens0714_26]|nr:MAG: beta-glucosidase [Parcubacteria group bacterium Athens0714_26]